MGCQCHGGEQRRRQPREQRSGGGERAAVAAASASTTARKDSLCTGIRVAHGYDNPVHINARARAWADDAMEDQRASGGLVNSKSAATSPSSSGTGAGKKTGTIDVVVRFEHTSGWGQSAEIPVVALSAITSGREGFVKNEAAAASAHQCRGKDALTVERSRTRQRN